MKYERSSSNVLFAAKIGLLAVGLVWLGHTAYVARAELCITMDSKLCEEPQGECPEFDCDNDWYSEPENIDWPELSQTGYYQFGIDYCTRVLCVTWSQCVLLTSGLCGPDPDTQTQVWQNEVIGIRLGCGLV